jgi:flavin reductase (DIM6/NTAB) family NADH-FMN oxidoreductase RutF
LSASTKFRDAMSRYPTGVTVVAAYYKGRAVGITANSFASVSLEPPLVLWSVARNAERAPAFLAAMSYSISFLNQDQADIAQFCAENDELPEGKWSENRYGFPIIDGANTVLDCRQFAVYPGGDHDIIVGEVVGISIADQSGALTFYKSDYGKLDQD